MRNVHKKQKNKQLGKWIGGVIVAVMITVALSGVLGIAMLNDMLDIKWTNFAVATIQLLSALVGSFFAYKQLNKSKLLTAGIVVGVYYLILISATLLLFDCSFERMGIGSIMCLTGAILTGIIGGLRHLRKTHRKFRL